MPFSWAAASACAIWLAVLDGPARRQRATRQAVTQRIAVQQFGDSESDAVLRADVVNPDDVRVRERGQRLRLPLEPREPLRIGGDHVREDFQCDLTLQPRVARPKDFAHASGPQRADDFVGTKAGTRGKGHRARDYSPGGVAGLKGVVLRLETARCCAKPQAMPCRSFGTGLPATMRNRARGFFR